MVSYFGSRGCKNHEKQASQVWIKDFGCCCLIRICFTVSSLYGEDENYDPTLGIVGSEVIKLAGRCPNQDGSKYQIVLDNFFTSPQLLSLLNKIRITATGTVQINRIEKAPLKSAQEM